MTRAEVFVASTIGLSASLHEHGVLNEPDGLTQTRRRFIHT